MRTCHCEFAYGSEELMQRFGEVENGRLKLGKRSYRAVVVPPAVTLRKSTYELLEALLADGGEVIVLNKIPPLCDGRKSDAKLSGARIVSFGGLEDALKKYSLRITDRDSFSADKVEAMLRRDGEESLCFIRNTLENAEVRFSVNLPSRASVYSYNMMSGEISPISHRVDRSGTSIDLTLAGGASIFLGWTESEDAVGYAEKQPIEIDRIDLEPPYNLTLDSPNLLIIDKFTVIDANGKPSGKKPTVAIKGSAGMTLEASFSVKTPIGSNLKLLVEYADALTVTLNGTTLTADGGSYIYSALNTLPIPDGCLKDGENSVRIYAPNGFLDSVQPIYISGDFATVRENEASAVITGNAPTTVNSDLTLEGLPFYAGNATLEAKLAIKPEKGKKYRLTLNRPSAITCSVTVNGREAGDILSAPYELDITELLVDGENSIAICLHGSLRNMIGPHHISKAPVLIKFSSPADFTSHAGFSDTYNCVRFGIGGISVSVLE